MNEKEQLIEWMSSAKFFRVERFRFTEHEDGRGSVVFCTATHTYHLSLRSRTWAAPPPPARFGQGRTGHEAATCRTARSTA